MRADLIFILIFIFLNLQQVRFKKKIPKITIFFSRFLQLYQKLQNQILRSKIYHQESLEITSFFQLNVNVIQTPVTSSVTSSFSCSVCRLVAEEIESLLGGTSEMSEEEQKKKKRKERRKSRAEKRRDR